MSVDKLGYVWATDDMKRLWIFDPLTLTVDSKIDLSSSFTLQSKSCLTIHPWIKGRMLIFDQVTGNGVVFSQRKIILRFKEHIDWTYAVGISQNRAELQAIVAGYHENRQIRYDLVKRRVKTFGIKEYDLAHNAVILDSQSAAISLVFESLLSMPVAKLYMDSVLQDELKLTCIKNIKFNKLFNLQSSAGLVACASGNTLTVIAIDGYSLRQTKIYTVQSADDDTQIEHVEALSKHYLIVCTRRAFYRLTI